ncbi:MAG: methionine ABC transporter permease [Pseudomonadota bacterium]|jgi:D-methionine transport system permease protein|uniref:D-methionine ABC transporter permease n=1 Tax=Vreelandella aquamarina TaxID=77097 RepID=A0A0D7V0L6_9GAMM|nr:MULTISPECIES: methionine ABC transporter permease [Halomonas]KTG25511.1 methionine ABC transporter permease [Idiomarina sp. H105]MEC7294846.1 methionine ABC transporter permease [Pseudomonadota bacterium]OAE96137.1 methionine ABC transporter permease [Idiomarina sp. WRN-38]KJD20371.1 methionine ABC transporter permease [Halomonas meridiana]MAD21730.1 ABC transporter permease [Halomonas sp.]
MSSAMFDLILQATLDTLYMVAVSGVIATLLGLPLGVMLYVTRPRQILAMPVLNQVLGIITNIGRSIPFIILMVAIIPFTRMLVGTSIGINAASVPLTIAAIPFVARLIEGALNEISPGLIESAQSMGATPWQIITKVLIPEARGGIITGLTITLVTLVSYSAMAGAVGGGGLGDLGIRYGYNRFNPTIMLITVVILVVLVQGFQSLGDYLVRKSDRK